MSDSQANDYITPTEFRAAEGMEAWPVLSNGATTFFRTGSFAESARLVAAIAGIEGVEGHRPAVDLRKDGVTVRLLAVADDWWGMSRRDIEMARRITAAAASLGLSPEPGAVQSVDPIVIGAEDIDRVRPFWRALMGYEPRADSPEEDLVDPRDRGLGIWFERGEGPRSARTGMHVA